MKHYNYIIAGAGAAGLSLAEKMVESGLLKDKTLLLIDPDQKDQNDRTWSYWTTKEDELSGIVAARWNKAVVRSSEGELQLDLAPYHYRTIHGIDFYRYAKAKLEACSNIDRLYHAVEAVLPGNTLNVVSNGETFTCDYLFDSRPVALEHSEEQPLIWQHFGGWVVETEQPVWDAETVTLMDFDLPQCGEVRFMYVLPFSEKKALVEYTGFGRNLLEPSDYDAEIIKYLLNKAGGSDYEVLEREYGKIPMTFAQPPQPQHANHIYIGTPGGAVKPSTGYAFARIRKQARQIADQLKKGNPVDATLSTSKYKRYDRTLLRVLYDQTVPGDQVFYQLFKKNKAATVLSFLNEESGLLQELGIMAKSPQGPFLKAFLKEK